MRRVRDRMSAAFRLTCSITGYAIASSEEAFDADANAGAAAWIPGCGRFGSRGWDGAIAAYHSAVPLFDAIYLRNVRAVWP